MRPDQRQHHKHKSKLPDLHADVEEEQGSRQQATFETSPANALAKPMP